MLMSLGLFTFSLQTAPFETIKRQTEQRWESKPRVGNAPALQYLGQGEDTITLDGTLAPELTGGNANLDRLRAMAATGKAWILVSGTGEVLDTWVIKSVEETGTHLRANGKPRLTTFTLTLKRYWDDDQTMLGKLMDSKP